jgi:hypothetical protein
VTATRPYLAFASGSLTYECSRCVRCCCGLGLADDPDHLADSPELLRLAPFVADDTPGLPLQTMHTYADGCRHLALDNLCRLHRDGGPAAKPLICRLFPFSKLADVGGLYTILPHHLCPWTANPGTTPSSLSDHDAVLADLDGALLDRVSPLVMTPVTAIEPTSRLSLEEALRDILSLDLEARDAIAATAERQADLAGPVRPEPDDDDLWLDMLRCAGEPPPLPASLQRLFVAALPAMRIHLTPRVPLDAVPTALSAFELWLRSLAELGRTSWTGEDLLLLLGRRAPLLALLAYAEHPLPPLEPGNGLPQEILPVIDELNRQSGKAVAEALLPALRVFERGALTAMLHVGELLTDALRAKARGR